MCISLLHSFMFTGPAVELTVNITDFNTTSIAIMWGTSYELSDVSNYVVTYYPADQPENGIFCERGIRRDELRDELHHHRSCTWV